jgi:hypothetical protein
MNATPSSALKHLHPGWFLPVLLGELEALLSRRS